MSGARAIRWLLGIALLAIIVGIASKLEFVERTVPMPLKGEAAINPFYAALKFSEELGVDASWQQTFDSRPADSIVVLSSWNWSLNRSRLERIERWVEGGGRLVVDDSLVGGEDEFEQWTGVAARYIQEDEDDDDDVESSEEDSPEADETERPRNQRSSRPTPEQREILGRLFEQDCTTLDEDDTGRALRVCDVDLSRELTSTRKVSWALRRDDRMHAVRVSVGRGSVTVINGAPFQRREFLNGDHAQLFVSATQLRHGDRLLFLTEQEHASIVSLLWRYGAPVVLLLAGMILLGIWRSIVRFGPLAAKFEAARRSLAEQIRGTGQFALRFGGGRALHAATVRALRDAAIRRFPNYDRLSAEQRVAAIAKATGVPPDDLAPALNFFGERSTHELRNSIAVLETARRRLLQRVKHGN